MKLFWPAVFGAALGVAVLTGALVSRWTAKPVAPLPASSVAAASRASASTRTAVPGDSRGRLWSDVGTPSSAPSALANTAPSTEAGAPAPGVAAPAPDVAPPAEADAENAGDDAGADERPERVYTRPAPAEAGLVVDRDGPSRGTSDAGVRSKDGAPVDASDLTRAAAGLGGVLSGGSSSTTSGATSSTSSSSTTTSPQSTTSQTNSAGASSTGARVRLVVSSATASVGDEVAVRVTIDGASGVGSVPFNVEFNSSVIQFERGTQGAFLGRDGWNVVFMIAPASAGNSVVVGLSRLGENSGVSGSGDLCTIYFKVVGSGAANLRFASGSVRDGANNVIAGAFESASLTAR